MVSNPFTNPNKVCNPSDSSERRKKSIRQFWPLEVLTGPNCHNNSCIKGKKNIEANSDELTFVWSHYELSVLPETDSNPHKKIQTRPQVRSIFRGTKFACVYLKINPINCPKVHYIVKWCNMGINWAQSIHLKPITNLKILIENQSFFW